MTRMTLTKGDRNAARRSAAVDLFRCTRTGGFVRNITTLKDGGIDVHYTIPSGKGVYHATADMISKQMETGE